MKIFVVSDVHGFYDEMRYALDQAGFNPEDDNHLLVSLGDIVDRGPKPVEVLEYLMGLKNKILVKGNHEDLAEEMMRTGEFHGHDVSNGTFDTFRLFAEHLSGNVISRNYALMDWDNVNNYVKHYSLWRKYLRECVNYYETANHIFVHGWIPAGEEVIKDWRKLATEEDWESARWARSPMMADMELFDPKGKKIVIGHWHTSDFHRRFGKNPEDRVIENFFPFYHPRFIACDACTAYSGFCNVVVIEDERIEEDVK